MKVLGAGTSHVEHGKTASTRLTTPETIDLKERVMLNKDFIIYDE